MSTQPSKRPASRDRRVHSAKARLTPEKDKSNSLEHHLQQQALKKEARERVTSAKAIKDKHHGSTKLFPRPPSRSSRERFTSSYSKDFDGTFLPPAELRPTSPTRRNNPHPAKQFMVWRVPSREIGRPIEEEGLELPPEYMAQYSEFDAIDELGRSVDELKLPPPQPTSKEYGAYLRRLPSQQSEQYYGGGMMARPKVVKPVTSELLGRTVKGANMSALDEWLKTASPEEQHTVLKMLKSAEEAQVKDTIGQVMQPAAAMAVTDWLKNAEEKERNVAVRLFSSLGSRPGSRRPRSRSEPAVKFRPSSRQPVPPPLEELKHGPYDSDQGQKLRTRRLSAPPNRKQKPWPAGIWHHLPVRDPPPQIYNRGSLFGAMRGGASHYTVHPEWPDYQNSTFNSDVVH